MSHANKSYNVGFIGVGIMGEALLSALIKSGYPTEKINFFEKREGEYTRVEIPTTIDGMFDEEF